MSAYVVNDDHIDALITFAVLKRVSYYFDGRWREIGDTTATDAGRILLTENERSVAHRYPGDDSRGEGPSYRFKMFPPDSVTPLAILKGVQGLEYQCSETPDWRTTEAHAILHAIERAAIRALPGYAAGAWEIKRPADAPVVISLSAMARGL